MPFLNFKSFWNILEHEAGKKRKKKIKKMKTKTTKQITVWKSRNKT